MVEGARGKRATSQEASGGKAPSTKPLRVLVPLPMPGRNLENHAATLVEN